MNRTAPRQGRNAWRGWLLAGLGAAVLAVGGLAAREWAATRVAAVGALDLRYLAGPMTLADLGPLQADFDVTRSGAAVLASTKGGLATIEAGGGASNLPLKGKALASLTLDDDDNLLTVSGGFLGRLNEAGEASEGVPLPYDDARLARSVHPGAFYLYGGRGGEWRLYRFWNNGRFEILMSSPNAIAGVADTGSAVYVATARAIYRLGGEGVRQVFSAPDQPGWGPITSVAATLKGEVLFATPTQVWAVAPDGSAGTLVNDAGGQIRLREGRVHVLDSNRRLLFSFAPKKG